jgi:hypothetical protein
MYMSEAVVHHTEVGDNVCGRLIRFGGDIECILLFNILIGAGVGVAESS